MMKYNKMTIDEKYTQEELDFIKKWGRPDDQEKEELGHCFADTDERVNILTQAQRRKKLFDAISPDGGNNRNS